MRNVVRRINKHHFISTMSLIPKSEIRDVTGLTNQQEEDILNFLQGAVYCWCKNRKDEWFSLRKLMGGVNYLWQETPLFVLYQKYQDQENAVEQAGKDGGWLLKKVIASDKRDFETRSAFKTREYRWISEQE